jgi:hypothetical protein
MPLFTAIKNKDIETLKLLLECHLIDINEKKIIETSYSTYYMAVYPLEYACDAGDLDIIKLLLEKDNIVIDKTIVSRIIGLGDLDIIKLLFKKDNIVIDKNTICIAVKGGNKEVIKFILETIPTPTSNIFTIQEPHEAGKIQTKQKCFSRWWHHN